MARQPDSSQTYDTPDQALHATDQFYQQRQGFEYTEQYVVDWLREFVTLPKRGRVLDLCCGDGIWSKGIAAINPDLELFGVDISQGGIEKARQLLNTDEHHFLVADAEAELPFPDAHFDMIFARGPGLYNQHAMDRPATIGVIERWHDKLTPAGRCWSLFASNPRHMGTYTPAENVKLPYNQCPRRTETVDFRGGKYHHGIESFLAPFFKARNVEIRDYAFRRNNHILVTRRV